MEAEERYYPTMRFRALIENYYAIRAMLKSFNKDSEIYFIIDKNNSLKEELEGQESDSSDKIEFKYIYSMNEIR